jgi:polyphosphate glucokinase
MGGKDTMQVLGIDVGGSGIKGAPIDLKSGELLKKRFRLPTPNPAKPKTVTQTIKKIIDHFNWHSAVGIGFPAAIKQGIVSTAANIDNSWIGVNIAKLIHKETGCKTYVINDADAAGLAEMEYGGGKNHQEFVIVITVGTGLGTALFNKRVLLPNTELGHITMYNKDAELYASDAVRKKEDLSWKKWAKRFNEYLAELEKLLWPDLLIIGGGASKKEEKFFPYLSTKAKIIPAQLLNDAGIIGAAFSTTLK